MSTLAPLINVLDTVSLQEVHHTQTDENATSYLMLSASAGRRCNQRSLNCCTCCSSPSCPGSHRSDAASRGELYKGISRNNEGQIGFHHVVSLS